TRSRLSAAWLLRRYSDVSRSARSRKTCRSLAVGLRAVARRKAKLILEAGSRPASPIMRWARARAASTYVGSFKRTRACRGVLVRARRAVHFSRSGASNVLSDGGGDVRFQNEYMLR